MYLGATDSGLDRMIFKTVFSDTLLHSYALVLQCIAMRGLSGECTVDKMVHAEN